MYEQKEEKSTKVVNILYTHIICTLLYVQQTSLENLKNIFILFYALIKFLSNQKKIYIRIHNMQVQAFMAFSDN